MVLVSESIKLVVRVLTPTCHELGVLGSVHVGDDVRLQARQRHVPREHLAQLLEQGQRFCVVPLREKRHI